MSEPAANTPAGTPTGTPAGDGVPEIVARLFDVRGKVAVVTGGSRGIGEMIAEGLVRAGVRVYITARKAGACDATAARLAELGECVSLPADVSSAPGAHALAAAVAEREPALHVLVNNAGVTWGEPLDTYPEAGFDKVLHTNVKGPFLVTQAFLPLLRAAARPDDPARVVNVTSVEGHRVPTLETYAYSASKAGANMLTRHLALRLAGENITVNAIAPGPFESRMMAFLLDDPETRARVASDCPIPRIGAPDDMAGAVIYLCSKASTYVTGSVLPVDGGLCAP